MIILHSNVTRRNAGSTCRSYVSHMASFPVPDEYKMVRHVQSVRTYVTELDQSNTPIVTGGPLYEWRGLGNSRHAWLAARPGINDPVEHPVDHYGYDSQWLYGQRAAVFHGKQNEFYAGWPHR